MKNTFYILGTADGKIFYRGNWTGFTDFSEEAYRFLIGKGFDDRDQMKRAIEEAKRQHDIDLVPFELTVEYKPSNILEN